MLHRHCFFISRNILFLLFFFRASYSSLMRIVENKKEKKKRPKLFVVRKITARLLFEAIAPFSLYRFN